MSGTHTAGTLLFSGTTHNTNGRTGGARSKDGQLDIRLTEPHPAAENLFGAAWSACYMGAMGVAAGQRKIKLPDGVAVDATIELLRDGSEFFLRAHMKVAVPGMDRAQAQELVDAAHQICPYSKAIHGNIEVTTELA